MLLRQFVCLLAVVGTALAVPAASFAGFALETIFNDVKGAWADYNNDGFVDVNIGGTLYKNNGFDHPSQGWFTSQGNLLVNEGVWGDHDNDGFLDWFSYGNKRLYHSNAGQSFTPVNLPNLPAGGSVTSAWADFNGDNYLDLYVGQYEGTGYDPDFLLINDTVGGFTHEWTQPNDAVVSGGQPRPARGTTVADWDQDGDFDVYVSNYRLEPNQLRRNNGSGNFSTILASDVGISHGATASQGHSIGSVWGDFNDDGLLDLFAGNFAHDGQPQSRFLKNLGASQDYRFGDMGTGGIFYQESYASPTAGDIDNDGDLDLYFSTVYIDSSHGPNWPVLFRNDGNFNFTDITASWGLPTGPTAQTATYQASFADFNGDGFLDLLTDGKLYRNNRSHNGSNNWLKVSLDGTGSFDRTAIGTQVRINRNGKTYTRQVSSTVGEGNGNDQTLHFGLGSHAGPVDLEITWPDGQVQTRTVNLPNQHVTIAKGPGPDDPDAQIFVSTSDTDPVIENPVINLGLGQSDSLYIWIKPDNNQIVRAGVDIESNASGVIRATAHEVYNPYSELVGKNRWDFTDNGQIDQLVSGSVGVAYQDGHGISSGLGLVDPPLFDPTTGAFLHSRVDIEAIGQGDAEIFLKVGSGLLRWALTDGVDGWALFGDEESYVPGTGVGATNDLADALIRVVVLGDFDGNSIVDSADIDLLHTAIYTQSTDFLFDLNDDGTVNSGDAAYLLTDIINTTSGDVDLDGRVDARDVAIVRNNMGYSHTFGPAPWGYGNVTGDSTVDEVDLWALRYKFGYVAPAGSPSPTPEPVSGVLLAIATVTLMRCGATRHQRRWCSPRNTHPDIDERRAT